MFKVSCFEKKETQLLVFSADNRFCMGLRVIRINVVILRELRCRKLGMDLDVLRIFRIVQKTPKSSAKSQKLLG